MRISAVAGAYYDYLQFVDQFVFGIEKPATPKMLLGTQVDAIVKNRLASTFDYEPDRFDSAVEITSGALEVANYYLSSPIYDELVEDIEEILNMDAPLEFDYGDIPLTGHPDLIYRSKAGHIRVVDFKTTRYFKTGWSQRYLNGKMKTKEPGRSLVEANFGWAVQLFCYGFLYQPCFLSIHALTEDSVTIYPWYSWDRDGALLIDNFIRSLWAQVQPGGHLYPNLSYEESEELRRLKCYSLPK